MRDELRDATAQNIMSMREEKWIVAGARMLAKRLLDEIQVPGEPKWTKKNMGHLLKFLLSEKYNMETYIYFYGGVKYRKTAGVLLDMAEREAEMIAILTGRTKEEVLNTLGLTEGGKNA